MNHFEVMAHYNIWATEKLNQTLSHVSDEDFFRDCGLFFNSIFGTLNHVLLAEHHLWYARFAEGRSPQMQLNSIVEHDRAQLLTVLAEKSQLWLDFLHKVPKERFEQNLDYISAAGVPSSLPFAPTLLHVFNHGTHHRGQITAALTMMGYECPELDIPFMLKDLQQKQS